MDPRRNVRSIPQLRARQIQRHNRPRAPVQRKQKSSVERVLRKAIGIVKLPDLSDLVGNVLRDCRKTWKKLARLK